MKQYQISYKDRDTLNEKLAVIRYQCEKTPCSDIVFYLTWTNSAREEIETVTGAIEDFFPGAAWYGNEASGNIAMGEFTYGVNITCSVFEEKTSRTELVWVEDGSAVSTLDELWAYCNTKKDLRGIELIPAIASLEELGIDRSEPDIDPGILIFGGASVNYDDPTFGADIIAKGHPMTGRGMAVMLYYGTELHFHAGDILGWKGMGKLMEVTDSTGKVIREIDRVPAYSVYEKYLNLSVEDKDTLVFPLIAEEDGYEFIRTPQIIRQDKSMLMFADIPAGTRVRISYGDKNTILNSLNEKAAEIAAYRPEAVKAYSCAARRLFWGDDEVGKETAIIQKIAPVCGFYTGGEILRFGRKLRVLNQTLALVSAREGEEKENESGNVYRHEEDKSLLSRLTCFAERIVEEEREQRILAEGFERVLSSEYQVVYYIDTVSGETTFLYGDEDAKKFSSIFNSSTAENIFDNFYRMYVDTVVLEEDREKVRSVMNIGNIIRSLKTGNSVSVNYRVRRNLVDAVYTEMRIFKAAEENGNLTAVLLAFKMSDEELRTALEIRQKLEENARIIGALSEDFGCVDYVEITDNVMSDRTVGIRASRLLNRLLPDWEKTDSFTGKAALMTEHLIYEPDREEFFKATRRETIIEALGTSDTYFVNTRMFYDGGIRYYQVKMSAVKENGRIVGLVVGTRSVDEYTRKEIETRKQLKDALAAAQSASKAKTDFLFNMSHDIRTPMNAVIGFTNMAMKHIDDRERVLDSLHKTQEASEMLLSLINDILDMSRIEAGKIDPDENEGDVFLSFSNIEATMQEMAKAKDLDLTFAVENIADRYVYADFSRCTRVFVNIITNAIKYTNPGGSIRVRCEQIGKAGDRGLYRYTFADTGIGMSEEFRKVAFDEFTREETATVSGIQGTGLGLAVCRTLVTAMNGTIECESRQGVGSTFTVVLPLRLQEGKKYTDPVSGLVVSGEAAEKKETPAGLSGRRVLLVEDNALNREIAEDILSEEGMTVETAPDGSVAVQILREKGPAYYDFILMDIQMPVMNGYEATRAIRAMYPKADIPIIALSANAFEEDRIASVTAGMNDHVAKPINIEELFTALARFL